MANNYVNVFVTNVNSIPTSGDTLSLAVGQVGVFNADTYAAVTAPSFPTVKAILLAQGKDNASFPMGIFKTNENSKSPAIKAQNITGWVGHKSQKPQNMVVTMGYDGIDSSKTLTPKAGKDVRFWLTLSGQPIANIMGGSSTTHYNTLTEEFTLTLPCLSDCVDNCSDTVDCNVVADEIIRVVNERKIIGGQDLSKYVKVSKLLDCDTPSGLPTVSCEKWQISVADTGDQVALGQVQAQYPGVTITRVSRVDAISTYELVVCNSSTPANLNTVTSPIIPNCSTCPSGYTSVAAANAFQVTRVSVTPVSTTTIGSTYSSGLISGSVVKLSAPSGLSEQVFTFYSTSTFTVVSAQAASNDAVVQIGTTQPICVATAGEITNLDIPWTDVGSCTKAHKFYTIDLKLANCNSGCSAELLTQLTAAYNLVGTVAFLASNTDTCTCRYQLTTTSSNASCETCNEQDYTFNFPDPFNGTVWTETTIGEGTSCVCGVKFESAYVQRDRQECFFDEVSYEVEPLFLSLSERNPNDRDFSQLCEATFPITIVQGIKYAVGYGSSTVSERFKLSRFYFNDPYKTDPAERNALAYELGVDLQGYYDEFVLTFLYQEPGTTNFSGFGHTLGEKFEWHVFYPAGQGAAFINAINSFVSYPSSPIAPISI